MPASPIILDRVQAGIETTRGTPVAATRKVYATARNQSYDRTLAARPSATGTLQSRRNPSYSRAMGGLSLSDVMTYQSAPWWGQLLWKTVAGVSDAGTPSPAYTYAFTPDLDTDTIKSATIEGIDKQTSYDWAQAMVNQWNLRWDSDSTSDPDWLLEATLLTLAPVPAAQTAALTDRSEDPIVARGTKVFIDEGAAGVIGATQRTGQAISGSISGNNNLSFPAYAENETGPPAGSVLRGEVTVDAQLVLSFQNDDDFADFRSDTPVLKKIRLERSFATAIHTTVFPRMRLDLYGYWSAIAWGDRNGERTVTLSLMTFMDITAGTAFRAEFVNSLAVLP